MHNFKEVLHAINKIIDYMYEDEKENWEECGKPENHIYTSLEVLYNFINSIYEWVDEI